MHLASGPVVDSLNNAGNIWLLRTLHKLPSSVQTAALLALVQETSADPGRPFAFYQLFYPPLTLILQEIAGMPKRTPDPDLYRSALEAQFAALALHLVDDHLSDGQMPVSAATLELRALLSRSWAESLRPLDTDAETESAWNLYLAALLQQLPVTLDGYLLRFNEQIRIWRLPPRLLARAAGYDEAQVLLVDTIINAFCRAWRIDDDLQDVHEDQDGESGLRLASASQLRQRFFEERDRAVAAAEELGFRNLADAIIACGEPYANPVT